MKNSITKLENWGFAVGISIFTFWSFISIFLGKKIKREFYAENYSLSIIFLIYSIISWILVFATMGKISPMVFVISFISVIVALYCMALIIWSSILKKNQNKSNNIAL